MLCIIVIFMYLCWWQLCAQNCASEGQRCNLKSLFSRRQAGMACRDMKDKGNESKDEV
jgi:hypothetical protein